MWAQVSLGSVTQLHCVQRDTGRCGSMSSRFLATRPHSSFSGPANSPTPTFEGTLHTAKTCPTIRLASIRRCVVASFQPRRARKSNGGGSRLPEHVWPMGPPTPTQVQGPTDGMGQTDPRAPVEKHHRAGAYQDISLDEIVDSLQKPHQKAKVTNDKAAAGLGMLCGMLCGMEAAMRAEAGRLQAQGGGCLSIC